MQNTAKALYLSPTELGTLFKKKYKFNRVILNSLTGTEVSEEVANDTADVENELPDFESDETEDEVDQDEVEEDEDEADDGEFNHDTLKCLVVFDCRIFFFCGGKIVHCYGARDMNFLRSSIF